MAAPKGKQPHDDSVDLLQVHAATAFTGLVGDGITHAGTAAVTEIKAGTLEVDPFNRLAAGAFAFILCVEGTGATLVAVAKNRLVAFGFEDVPPFERRTAAADAGAGLDCVAVAGRTAVAGIEHILPLLYLRGHHLLFPRLLWFAH